MDEIGIVLIFNNHLRKHGDETVDLTNIPYERVSGVLKNEYRNTSFGSIRISSKYWSDLTWAKQLRSIRYWERNEIGTSWSASQSSARRVHAVYLWFFLSIVEAQLTDEGVKTIAIHIMVDKNLLSRPDLLDRFSNLNSSFNIWKSILKQSQS